MRTIGRVFLLLAAATAWAGSPLDEAISAYQYNEPVKARALFEEALAADPTNPKIYYWLGAVYQQLGDAERASAILQRGLAVAGDLRPQFYVSLGDIQYRRNDAPQAEKMYGEAIAADQALATAWLNRANARVNQAKFQGAIADYTMYLTLAPESRKRADVEKMIALISGQMQQQETAERERNEREKALMDQVLDALKNASDDARNLSTKWDRVLEERDEEIEIEQ